MFSNCVAVTHFNQANLTTVKKIIFYSVQLTNTRAEMLMVSESSNAAPMVLMGTAGFKPSKKHISNRFHRGKMEPVHYKCW